MGRFNLYSERVGVKGMITKLDLGNYYGIVCIVKRGDKYYMTLDNYNGVDELEISQEAYEALFADKSCHYKGE